MGNCSIVDSIDYPNKSYTLQMVDGSLAPLRIICNGRHLPLDVEDNETDIKAHSLGLKILASLAALLTLPVILVALAVKWWKKEEWQGVLLRNAQPVEPKMDKVDKFEDVEVEIVPEEQEEFTKSIQDESQPVESKMDKVDEIEDSEEEEEMVPKDQEGFAKFIQDEYACAQHLDVKLPDPEKGSWREYGKERWEYNQKLANYIQGRKKSWPDHRPIHIKQLGTFSKLDLKIVSITSDYLHIFHNLPIQFCQDILTMEQLKEKYLKVSQENLQQPCHTDEEKESVEALQRWYQQIEENMDNGFPRKKDGQYDTDVAIDLMEIAILPDLKNDVVKNPQVIAFTNEDLFSPDLTNFVFGTASLSGIGIWSNARFGDPSSSPEAFEKCLIRMMKIAAHEFGHMRGLRHCTDYDCNIGGYMSRLELDSRPLLYCLQDTAKICYLTQISMLQYHKRLLKFFENFNQTYDLNCDFSKEIETLKGRIAVLTKVEEVD